MSTILYVSYILIELGINGGKVHIAGGKCKRGQPLWATPWQFLRTVKCRVTIGPSRFHSSMYICKRIENRCSHKTYTQMLIASDL